MEHKSDKKSDRHSRMPLSSVKAPAKKGGAGGHYTWGKPGEVVDDHVPSAPVQPKVITSSVASSSAEAPVVGEPEAPPRRTSSNFPKLEGSAARPQEAPRSTWLTLSAAQKKVLKVALAAGTCGALAAGAAGTAIGAACGGAVGLAVGTIPALFTFGLSIPAGGIVGGGLGAATGAAAGSGTGFVAGTVTGGAVYSRRGYFWKLWRKLKSTPAGEQVVGTWVSATSTLSEYRKAAVEQYEVTRSLVTSQVQAVRSKSTRWWALAKDQASDAKEAIKQTSEDPAAKVAIASGCGGAVVLGATGGGAGFLAGAAAGAAAGIVPAIFTFGLSIPIGAAIGSGCGLVAGSAVGGTVGLVGGGTVGYKAYTKKDDIREAVGSGVSQVTGMAEGLRERFLGARQSS